MKSFAPNHDLVLILPSEAANRHGALFLPAKRASLPTTVGTVIAAGPGAITVMGKREPMDLVIGSKVVIRNAGEDHPHLKIGDVDHILVRFGDILGSIED